MKRFNYSRALATSLLIAASFPAIAQEESLPGVTIFATGGTIAGSAASNTDTTGYTSGEIGVQQLIDAVPQLTDIAQISGEQVANTKSSNVDQEILLNLYSAISDSLSDEGIHGALITHGTDTLEETGFFLDLTIDSDKPVIMVGAMRPATAISADGPINLLQAVTLAAAEDAKGRGTMVVLNDRIGSAYFTTKTNSLTPDTFKAIEQGYLGVFVGNQPYFYYPAVKPVNKPSFDLSEVESLPRIDIIYGYQDVDDVLIQASIDAGAKGIVIAGSGNGSIPDRMDQAVEDAMSNGIPVVRATRTGNGVVTPKDIGIGAGVYNPQKARILLMLALATGEDISAIREHFQGAL